MSRTFRVDSLRLKILISIGILSPSVADVVAPGDGEVRRIANIVMLVTALMWVWEL